MLREQDQYMPVANIIRIMRRILPPNAKISDDAKETIQECVSEYISFVTGEANERCQREHRKTVTADDLLWAMGKLGFDNYVDPLSSFLTRYRESEGDRASYRGHPLLHNKSTAAPQDFATMMMMQQQLQHQQLLQHQQQQQQQQQQQPNINSYMQDGAFQVMQGDHNNNNNQGILYDDAAAGVLNSYYGAAVDPFGGSSSSSGAGGTDGTCQKNGLPNFDIYSQFK
ncbi:Nuclear transcription factor Y subunit B-9 [Linum perenne]